MLPAQTVTTGNCLDSSDFTPYPTVGSEDVNAVRGPVKLCGSDWKIPGTFHAPVATGDEAGQQPPPHQQEFPVHKDTLDRPPGPYHPTFCPKYPTQPNPEPSYKEVDICRTEANIPAEYSTVIKGDVCHDTERRPRESKIPVYHAPREPSQGSPESYPLLKEKRCNCEPGHCRCCYGSGKPSVDGVGPEVEKPEVVKEPFEFYPGLMDKDRLGKLRPTVFRSSGERFSHGEWSRQHENRISQAAGDLENSARLSFQSKCSMSNTASRTACTQHDATRLVSRRLDEMHLAKMDYEELIKNMRDETDRLIERKRRMERAIVTIGKAQMSNDECLRLLTLRRGIELVKDVAETDLQDEKALIKDVLGLLTRTVGQAHDQIGRNRAIKERIEKDWGDKSEAFDMDQNATALSDCTPTNLNHAGMARFQEWQSTPETLEEFSQKNIRDMMAEFDMSIRLRAAIDRVLADSAQQLRFKGAQVDTSIAQRLYESEVAKKELQEKLRKVLDNLAENENMINKLRQAIVDKNLPMKKTQTRLYLRSFRPGMEMCRDSAQYKLIEEVGELNQSVTELEDRMRHMQESVNRLHETRLDLEDDISRKTETINLLHQCERSRSSYPSAVKMVGL